MTGNQEYRLLRSFEAPHSRKAFEVESLNNPQGITTRLVFYFPSGAANCIFVQGVSFTHSMPAAPTTFFDTLQLSVTQQAPTQKPSSLPPDAKASAIDRLEQLRELRRRDLITQEEYEQRRKAILDGL